MLIKRLSDRASKLTASVFFAFCVLACRSAMYFLKGKRAASMHGWKQRKIGGPSLPALTFASLRVGVRQTSR